MEINQKLYRRLPELNELYKLTQIHKFKDELVRFKTLGHTTYRNKEYPLIAVEIGPEDKTLPSLGLFGGVHGLEKIGTHVILSFLNSTFNKLAWDKDLQELFKTTRVLSIPIVNPAGMAYNMRSNGRGVDLMRNAPVDSDPQDSTPLISGHRIGPQLPWFRGRAGEEMEVEAKTLCDYVEAECFPSNCHLSIDFHSGFGMRDRFWYPFAKSKEEYPRIDEVKNIKALLDKTFPYHIYQVEPQSKVYTTHGDLWDYLFLKHQGQQDSPPQNIFMPWTLEMGSWIWLKKNPAQVFNPMGLYNPIKEHRYERIMRRHLLLIDFLLRLTRNSEAWSSQK